MFTATQATTVRRADLRGIGPLVALVVAAHVLLLALPRQVAMASGLPTANERAVQFRLVTLPKDAAAGSTAAINDEAVPKSLEPPPAATAQAVEPLLTPEVDAAPVLAQAAHLADLPALLGVSMPGVASDDDRFIARSLLSVAPLALQPVTIDYPVFAGDVGRYVSELSLYIDETGTVVKVRVESDPLPPPLEAAVRSAFMNLRFRPGEVADVGVVKSRIRIEVVFDNGQVGA